MIDIINDLSTLTTIPYVSLERLVDLSVACISHSIEESLLDDETYTVVDIGVGRLSIKVEDNTILYKFIPSTKLEDTIRQTILSGKSPLTVKVEETLKDKITKTYKDFI